MKLEVNGIAYDSFTSASAELRLDALSNTFNFDAVSTVRNPLPFRGGEECRVLVDGETAVTGFIEVVTGDYSADSHTVSVQGRDKTADLLDSGLSTMADIRAPVTLKAIIEQVVANIGVELTVVDRANPTAFNEAEDIAVQLPVVRQKMFA